MINYDKIREEILSVIKNCKKSIIKKYKKTKLTGPIYHGYAPERKN